MKIYFPNIPISKIKIEYINKYLTAQKTDKKLLSDEGILHLNGNKILRITPSEYPIICQKLEMGNNIIDIIIDTNKWLIEENEEWMQIYPNSIEEITDIYTYQLRKGSIVNFIIEKQRNKITNWYFLVKNNDNKNDNKNKNNNDNINNNLNKIDINNNKMVKNDIHTFLSELKLY